MELPILVRGQYKDTVARYDIVTIFIFIERYVKFYIFDCVEIVHDRALAICVIATGTLYLLGESSPELKAHA